MLSSILFAASPFSSVEVLAARIYRSPTSLYASGEENDDYLKKQTQVVVSKLWYKVEWKQKSGWIQSDHLILPQHLVRAATVKSVAPLRAMTNWKLNPFGTLPVGQSVEIVRMEENWALVSTPSGATAKQGWTEYSNLTDARNDWGYYIFKVDGEIRNAPNPTAAITKRVPVGTRVIGGSEVGEWVKVFLDGLPGFVPLSNLLTKMDFARAVRVNSRWYKIEDIIGPWIRLEPGGPFTDFSSIHGIELGSHLAIASHSQAEIYDQPSVESDLIDRLSHLQPVKIVDREVVQWGQARVKNHKTIWWQVASNPLRNLLQETSPTPEAITSHSLSRKTLTTEALFSRKVFDIATSPTVPNLMFASAKGLFRTVDGKTWSAIELFKNDDHPIAIAKDGTIYVGSFRSDDQGNTFQNYIRWEKLITLIHSQIHREPKELRIEKIRVSGNKNNIIELSVRTDHPNPIKLISDNQGHTWSLLQ